MASDRGRSAASIRTAPASSPHGSAALPMRAGCLAPAGRARRCGQGGRDSKVRSAIVWCAVMNTMKLRVAIALATLVLGAGWSAGCGSDETGGPGDSGGDTSTGGPSSGAATSGGTSTSSTSTSGTSTGDTSTSAMSTGSGTEGWGCSNGQFNGAPSCTCCNPSTCDANATSTPCSASWSCCRHAVTATGEVCACTNDAVCDTIVAGNDTYAPVSSCPP
jgi:hypothetical protein